MGLKTQQHSSLINILPRRFSYRSIIISSCGVIPSPLSGLIIINAINIAAHLMTDDREAAGAAAAAEENRMKLANFQKSISRFTSGVGDESSQGLTCSLAKAQNWRD